MGACVCLPFPLSAEASAPTSLAPCLASSGGGCRQCRVTRSGVGSQERGSQGSRQYACTAAGQTVCIPSRLPLVCARIPAAHARRSHTQLKPTSAGAAHGALEARIHTELRGGQEGAPARRLLQVQTALRAETAARVSGMRRTHVSATGRRGPRRGGGLARLGRPLATERDARRRHGMCALTCGDWIALWPGVLPCSHQALVPVSLVDSHAFLPCCTDAHARTHT